MYRSWPQCSGEGLEEPLVARIASVPTVAPSPRVAEDAAPLPLEYLFDAASEAVLVVDALSGRIVEANAAATALLRNGARELQGRMLAQQFVASHRGRIHAALRRARRAGSAAVRCANTAGCERPLSLAVSAIRVTAQASALLVRLDPLMAARSGTNLRSPVLESIEEARFGFVVTDIEWLVQYANAAFMALIGIGAAQLAGRPITEWLRLTTEQAKLLGRQMAERRAVSEFCARLSCGIDGLRPFQLCAVAVPAGREPACWGLCFSEFQQSKALS